MQTDNPTMNAPSLSRFSSEVLLVFIGHSSDADTEAKAICDLERDLQRELERLQNIANAGLPFKTVRFWEWNYDAPPNVGGQDTTISPDLDRANIAIFVFKERVGVATWDELERSRNRTPSQIPVVALFSANPPESKRMADLAVVEGWSELLKKKRSLAADWMAPNSKSLRPTPDYEDVNHLKKIVLEQLKSALDLVLRPQSIIVVDSVTVTTTIHFLGDHPHLSYDRRPVLMHIVEELDQKRVDRFIQRPLSRQQLQKQGLLSEGSSVSHIEQLGILGCVCDGRPAFGAFLCFAPAALIADKFDGCSLQMVVYSGTKKASSKPSITLARGNLLELFEDGIAWLTNGSGLRRRGRVGSSERDELEIPEIVLHEALANALVHRDYETPELRDQPTRLEVYLDRLEITSYGNLPPAVSIESLNQDAEGIVPFRRNPVIAKIFQHMSHAELNASGVPRMRSEMEKASLAFPRFIADLHESVVRVVLLRPSNWVEESEVAPTLRRSEPRRMKAFISSTALDLSEHRQQAIDACLRQGIFPSALEHLPASEADAIRVSLQMVDEADIYIGIYAWRYGHVPAGHDISISEIEFNRAVERGIPILVFTIHKDHPLTLQMVEADSNAQDKLKQLKERACHGRGHLEFRSPVELRSHIIQSLSALLKEKEAEHQEQRAPSFHPPNLMPMAPVPYIAHPYSLLQTREVVGRHAELHQLTDWVTANTTVPRDVRLFTVVAIGGMGKSALAWKWFNDIAPNEVPHLAGRMWWSFYESDAYFENFVIRALAYTAGLPEAEVRQMSAPEREDQLWHVLDQRPFLLVLDGLERILLAYARMDAAHLPDDGLDEQTANDIARFYGLPDNVKETYLEKHRLRQCTDPRAGYFLRRLAQVRASRLLISTRLYPAELQTLTAQPRPGCYPLFLTGLSDDDALALWRAFTGGTRSGSSEQLLPLFRAFGNYPLLLRALAGEVAGYRPAPGDFDRWLQTHADFNPAALPLQNARTHVLECAMRGLSTEQRQVLHTIAAFRMPATWETLRAVLVGEEQKPCRDDRALDAVLTELEDRGLVGWDKVAACYDLHPIVRGVVWQALDARARRDIYGALHSYFDAAPRPPAWEQVESLEDLTTGIELFHTLIGLGRYEDAYVVFRDHLSDAMRYRLNANRQQVELLEQLFPDGVETLPRLRSVRHQGYMLNQLAVAYQSSGKPGRAEPLFRRALEIEEQEKDGGAAARALYHLAGTLRFSGHLREAETTACRALGMCRKQGRRLQECASLEVIGLTLAARGEASTSAVALYRSLNILVAQKNEQGEGFINAVLAQRCLWLSQPGAALPPAQRAWELAHIKREEYDFIRAARLHGEAALGLGDLTTATERLYYALTRARAVNVVEEELHALTALAELHRQQQHYDTTRELLDQVWTPAERGPYPLFHTDALNILAQLERDQGRREAAVTAATEAYRQAWCDGPPYAYHFGLTNARRHLQELGATEPQMPPFDASKYELMPEVELDPEDEFHVGKIAEA